jgi:hypothetical protein
MKVETSLLASYKNKETQKESIIKNWSKYKPKVEEGRITLSRENEPILIWFYITFEIPDDEEVPNNLPGIRKINPS